VNKENRLKYYYP